MPTPDTMSTDGFDPNILALEPPNYVLDVVDPLENV